MYDSTIHINGQIPYSINLDLEPSMLPILTSIPP